ncbi:MAG TPA: hydantoinase/oxoprolinase family protein [Bordetella sp.]
MSYRVGVDIGGSFADFAVLDTETNELVALKVFSRADAPGDDVKAGLAKLREDHGIDLSRIEYFTHGTTVGVNAVVQGKGSRLGLIANRHFEDVFELARLKTPDMYDLFSKRPAPIVPRERVRGIDGRMGPDGAEIDPLSVEQALEAARDLFEREQCEGILISFLHAYRNPAHERSAKAAIMAQYPDRFVLCSSEVWPIVREFERTITAGVAAYTQPIINRYLTRLQGVLDGLGVPADLHVTKSNGGVMRADTAKDDSIQVILSGTASGVIGASYIAERSGQPNCLSLDIGGTTADVAIIENATPHFTTGEYVGEYQIFIPSVSVNSIGDGGGSIAWVDSFGVLKVGPESAGSNPGPVCFRRGGTRPTITDAYAVLGYIGHHPLSYGAVTLDREGAARAIGELAGKLGKTVHETAAAIIDVSVSGMYAGVSQLISRYGIDPKDYTLLPFGGAGPMMACHFARAIRMKRILVPHTPGVLSALGGLIADTRNDFVKTTFYKLDEDYAPRLKEDFLALRTTAADWIESETGQASNYGLEAIADMRYKGQSFEVPTALSVDDVTSLNIAGMRASFNEQYQRIYGYSDTDAPIQIITLRVVVSAENPKPVMPRIAQADAEAQPAYRTELFVDGSLCDTPVYGRETLRAGHRIAGPAIVTQSDTTISILPGFEAVVDPHGNILIEYQQH